MFVNLFYMLLLFVTHASVFILLIKIENLCVIWFLIKKTIVAVVFVSLALFLMTQ